MTLRLYIVDDHPVVLEGIRRFVATEPTIEVVGAATNVADAIAGVDEAAPDVVSLDLRIPGMEGRDTVTALDGANRAILLFTLEEPSDSVAALIAAGARGYVSKSQGLETYVRAVIALGRGERVIPDALATTTGAVDPREVLTPRELELFIHLARGASIKEAAYAIGCSTSTAYSHFARIKEKVGVTSPADVIEVGRRWLFDLG